jgi:hypothetical protein
MIKLIKLNLFICVVMFFASCATSMTPMQVNSTLPTLTKSKFISQAQADEAVKENNCKYLVKGRNYTAPMGISVKEDLRYGAKGIDEWVKLDGGNAYVLVSYNWLTIGENGSTQLYVVFDTMLCD